MLSQRSWEYVAYSKVEADKSVTLYVRGASTEGAGRVMAKNYIEAVSVPGTSKFLYFANWRAPLFDLYTVDAKGGDPALIAKDIEHPSGYRLVNGNFVVYVHKGADAGLYAQRIR